MLAKAIGIKGKNLPFVLDTTAGFGGDSYILASLGCEVIMLERSPIVGVLLKNGLERAKSTLQQKNIKISLEVSQSVDYIDSFINTATKETKYPDVVYIDPMYPKNEKSALNKKKMRDLRAIVGDDLDADALFIAACKIAQKRVVVKRPRFAPLISDSKPTLTISSNSSSRYDIYLMTTNK